MRQTECNRKKDKISKFFGKTFFYFVSEAIKCENNTFITREVFQVDKSDYSSCYKKTVEKMWDSENVIQEISFSSVGQNQKFLTACSTWSEIKILLPEDLKNLEIRETQTKQRFHLAFGHNYANYFNSTLRNTIICTHFVLQEI